MDVLCSSLADIKSVGRLCFLDTFCFCSLLLAGFLLLLPSTQGLQKLWVLLGTFMSAEDFLDCRKSLKIPLLLGGKSDMLLFNVTFSNSHNL